MVTPNELRDCNCHRLMDRDGNLQHQTTCFVVRLETLRNRTEQLVAIAKCMPTVGASVGLTELFKDAIANAEEAVKAAA